MNELALIASIRKWCRTAPTPGLIASIGDDAAILRPRPNHDLLITTDFLIEDVHFTHSSLSPADTGRKALARALSDIAAMGGAPTYALVSLALAPWTTAAFVRSFYRGLTQLAALHGVSIIGGDLSKTGKFTADIVVIGSVPRGLALRRDTAQPGDILYVSGPLGRAASRNFTDVPTPRLDLAPRLRRKATSCIDLSDSLALDLHRLCLASGLAAELDGPLPVAPGATLDHALFGGEDYELLCTLPPGIRPPNSLVRIGRALPGRPGQVRFAGRLLKPRGWDPLQNYTLR
ncbi:MAG: thiamine-monophosphate kinase [Candidatus Solibacter usitatus]|nr:thiamine-monophosphate kinase [Candidatus Solibacter usitatus]